MKSIRIGNDIRIEWPIVLSGDVSKLQDLDLTVEVRPSAKVVDWHNYIEQPTLHRGKHSVMMNGGIAFRPDIGDGKEHSHPHRPKPVVPYVKLPYHIEDNTLIAMWTADRQFAVGDYDIILYAHKNEGGQAVCDQYRFVRLVAHSAQADAPDDSGIEAVIAMQPVTLKLAGLSAYEVAVINGFNGTEEEWLESLKVFTIENLTPENLEIFLNGMGFRGVEKIDVGNLDSLADDGRINGIKPMFFLVTSDAGIKDVNVVGTLQMFGDYGGNVLTQELSTHLLLDDDGSLTSTNDDDKIFHYYRSYAKDKETWSEWKTVYDGTQNPDLSDLRNSITDLTDTTNGIKNELENLQNAGYVYSGIAVPSTMPVKNNTPVFYIAQDKGIYTNFGNISVNDNEIAILRSVKDGVWIKDKLQNAGGGTITNNPDEEDLTSEGDDTNKVLKFKNRAYSPSSFSGKGYEILRKNMSDGNNILTSEMVNKENTVYEIRYDYDLGGAAIDMSNGCVLVFNGGSFRNGTLKSHKTMIVNPPSRDCLYGIFYNTDGIRLNDKFKPAKTSVDCVDPVVPYSTQYVNICCDNARKSSIDKMEIIYFLKYSDGVVSPADDLAFWQGGTIQQLIQLVEAQGQTVYSIKFHKNAGFTSTESPELERQAFYDYVMDVVDEFSRHTDTVKSVYISNEETTRTTAGNVWNDTHKALTTALHEKGYKVGISCNNISGTFRNMTWYLYVVS